MNLFGMKKGAHPHCRGGAGHALLFVVLSAAAVTALLLTSTGCTPAARARHFNSTAAEPESKSERVVRELGIRAGSAVADLGAGGGYFTYKLARAAGPSGRVFAVDVDADFLTIIREGARKRNLANIKTVQAGGDSSGLKHASVDLIFSRNVYHHLENRPAYFRRLRGSLKPGGRIALIDYDGGFWHKIFGHSTSPAVIIKEMKGAGYTLAERKNFLEKQSFLIFKPADARK